MRGIQGGGGGGGEWNRKEEEGERKRRRERERKNKAERGWIAMIYEDWRPGLKPDSRDASLIASEPHKSSRLPRGLSFSLFTLPHILSYSPHGQRCILFLIFFGPPLSSLQSNYNDRNIEGIIIALL